uniref:Uncharacterized protein n=1 Tax=Acrobeloides nanus TaxID=290746 RepID=A0A914DD03_9BILA
MKDIEPVLVTFPEAKYSEKLICSLLKLLGCVIPGEVDLSQEAILSAFGILPNFARNYNGLYEFFDRFLQMLSQMESATREFRGKFAVARLQT